MTEPLTTRLRASTSRIAEALFPAGSQLRRYDPACDLDAVVNLLWKPIRERDPGAVVRTEATRSSIASGVERGTALIAILDRPEPVSGVVWANVLAPEPACVLYVEELVLEAPLRGRGTGAAMLQELERAAREAHADGIALDFMANNARVEHLYERLGYEVVGYDLVRPATAHELPPGAAVDSLGHDDTMRRVAHQVAEERSLHRFERPRPDTADVLEELRCSVGDGRTFLETVRSPDSDELGYVWYELQTSRLSGAPIVSIRALGGCRQAGSTRRALALLASVDAHLRSSGEPRTTFLTSWEPTQELLDVFERCGFSVGRSKMYKSLL